MRILKKVEILRKYMKTELWLVGKCEEIICQLLSNNPVCSLTGNEFEKVDGRSLMQQLKDYFESNGQVADTPFGYVLIDKKGLKSTIYHGMSREKAAAFAAIKPTLEKGSIILPLEYYGIHGKKQKTGMIAAPILLRKEKYFCVVVVIDNNTTNRLYVHEVFLTKKLFEDVADSNAVLGAIEPVTHPQGEIAKVLKYYLQKSISKEEN